MSEKSIILSDYFGKLILKEVRGISFEVRAWANIIKSVIDSEYQKYLDYERKNYKKYQAKSYQYGSFFSSPYSDYSFNDDTDNFYPATNKGKLTIADLATMDQDEIDNMLDNIMWYHDLRYDEVMELENAEIIDLYNKTIDEDNNINESVETPVARPTKIIINGKDYPEAFANFSVDKWVISDNTPTEYDHTTSGYQDNGEYTVFINCGLNNVSLFVLIHEIKHAYQDWQRMSKGKPPIRQSKEIQQLYTKDFEKFILSHQGGYNLKTLDSVISAYYMSSDAEITAYLEGVYDDIHGGTSHPQLAGQLIKLGNNMIKFTSSQVDSNIPPASLQKRWLKIIEEYNIPLFRKFKNVFDFLKYTERTFNKKGKYIINKIDKLRNMKDHE